MIFTIGLSQFSNFGSCMYAACVPDFVIQNPNTSVLMTFCCYHTIGVMTTVVTNPDLFLNVFVCVRADQKKY